MCGIVNPLSVACLHPKKVINPYTHETLTVSCGKCEACILKKNNRYAFQCDLESLSHKYCVFITLTYDNFNIPRARFVETSTDIYDVCDLSNGVVLQTGCVLSTEQLDLLKNKFRLNGDIPYLSKYDLQLFFKRFRYFASRVSSEKVRYFAVGEYGPVHYRPHYHILLWFSDSELLSCCSEIVHKAWSFGRVDCQLSKGKTNNYVASYINSSGTLPKVFKIPAFRPFCVHSQRLGQGFLSAEREKVYETSVSDFVSRCLVVNGKYKEFDLWRSCYSYFYPKCKGFANLSTSELSFVYRLYHYAKIAFPYASTCADLSRDIAIYIRDYRSTFGLDVTHPSNKYSNVISYFFHDSLFSYYASDCLNDTDLLNKFASRIYTELLNSKHFLYYVCDHTTTYEINRKISLIKEFYSKLDYLHLVDFFESQRQYYESDLNDSDVYRKDDFDNVFNPFFYDNVYVDFGTLRSCESFRLFSAEQLNLSSKRVKHKVLNDKNLIFNF